MAAAVNTAVYVRLGVRMYVGVSAVVAGCVFKTVCVAKCLQDIIT